MFSGFSGPDPAQLLGISVLPVLLEWHFILVEVGLLSTTEHPFRADPAVDDLIAAELEFRTRNVSWVRRLAERIRLSQRIYQRPSIQKMWSSGPTSLSRKTNISLIEAVRLEMKNIRTQTAAIMSQFLTLRNTGSTATDTAVASAFDLDFKVFLGFDASPAGPSGSSGVLDGLHRRASVHDFFHYLQLLLRDPKKSASFVLPVLPAHLERMRAAFTTLTYLQYVGAPDHVDGFAPFTLDVAIQSGGLLLPSPTESTTSSSTTRTTGANYYPNAELHEERSDQQQSSAELHEERSEHGGGSRGSGEGGTTHHQDDVYFLQTVLARMSPIVRELLRLAKRWFKDRVDSVGDTTSNGLNSLSIQMLVLIFLEESLSGAGMGTAEQGRWDWRARLVEDETPKTADHAVQGGGVQLPLERGPLSSQQTSMVFVLFLEFLAFLVKLFEVTVLKGQKQKFWCELVTSASSAAEEEDGGEDPDLSSKPRLFPYVCHSDRIPQHENHLHDWQLWIGGGQMPPQSLREGDYVVNTKDQRTGVIEQLLRPSERMSSIPEPVASSKMKNLGEITGLRVRWAATAESISGRRDQVAPTTSHEVVGSSHDRASGHVEEVPAAELDTVFESQVFELAKDELLSDPDMMSQWGRLGAGSLVKLQSYPERDYVMENGRGEKLVRVSVVHAVEASGRSEVGYVC